MNVQVAFKDLNGVIFWFFEYKNQKTWVELYIIGDPREDIISVGVTEKTWW